MRKAQQGCEPCNAPLPGGDFPRGGQRADAPQRGATRRGASTGGCVAPAVLASYPHHVIQHAALAMVAAGSDAPNVMSLVCAASLQGGNAPACDGGWATRRRRSTAGGGIAPVTPVCHSLGRCQHAEPVTVAVGGHAPTLAAGLHHGAHPDQRNFRRRRWAQLPATTGYCPAVHDKEGATAAERDGSGASTHMQTAK